MARATVDELRSIFAAFDRDGNGAVSKKEFVEGVRRSARLTALFKLNDWATAAGQDGKLDLTEFVELARSAGTLDERPVFAATSEWQEVPHDAVCPVGLEYKMDLSTGRVKARRPVVGASAAK